jgi:hypothetical protein
MSCGEDGVRAGEGQGERAGEGQEAPKGCGNEATVLDSCQTSRLRQVPRRARVHAELLEAEGRSTALAYAWRSTYAFMAKWRLQPPSCMHSSLLCFDYIASLVIISLQVDRRPLVAG